MHLRDLLALEEVEEAGGNLDQEVTELTCDSRQVRREKFLPFLERRSTATSSSLK
jgi:hypothetical protein